MKEMARSIHVVHRVGGIIETWTTGAYFMGCQGSP
jgi:hypothetical protein